MVEKTIKNLIGQAIREGKYLDIKYKNKNAAVTQFWISILDLNGQDELYVNMFNVTKDKPHLNIKIFISSIQKVEILKFSYYEVPDMLLQKLEIDKNLKEYKFRHILSLNT